MEYIKKVTQEIINKILSKGVKDMPQNPSAQGLTAAQIREFYYAPEKMTLELIAEIENAVAEAFNQIPTNDGYSKEDIDGIVNGIAEQIANRYTKEETYSAKQIDEKIANVGGGGGTSTDVQVNGVSITKDGVANIPYASGDKAGLFKSNSASGIFIDGNSGSGSIVKAPTATISAKTNNFQPIVPSNLDYAVKVGITTNTETLSPEEQTSACEWLGALKKVVLSGNVRLYGVDATGKQSMYVFASSVGSSSAGRVPLIFAGSDTTVDTTEPAGYIITRTPLFNYHCANKKYVVNLPDYLTAEEKAKWESWLGGGGGGTKLYLHQVPIHAIQAVEGLVLQYIYFL